MRLVRPKSTPAYLIRMRAATDLNPERYEEFKIFQQPFSAKREIRPRSSFIELPGKRNEMPHVRAKYKDCKQPGHGKKKAHSPYEQTQALISRPKSCGESKRIDSNQVDVVECWDLGSGFTFSRTQERRAITINEPEIESERSESEQEVREGGVEFGDQTQLILELQQQITTLSIFLEEERLNHKLTKQQASEELHQRLSLIVEEHKDELNDLKRSHGVEFEKQQTLFHKTIEEIRLNHSKELSKKIDEYQFLRAAFESYKKENVQETEAKMRVLEANLSERAANEKREAVKQKEMEMQAAENKRLNVLKQNHEKALELEKYKAETEKQAMLKRFAEASEDLKNMKKTLDELDEMRDRQTILEQENQALGTQLSKREKNLKDALIKLAEFEHCFQSKVDEVEDKYWVKSELMMSENADIKRRYKDKCAQFFEYKAEAESSWREEAMTATETMKRLVAAREKAGLSIACNNRQLDDVPKKNYNRSLSTPGTGVEEEMARLCAGESSVEKRSDKIKLQKHDHFRCKSSHNF